MVTAKNRRKWTTYTPLKETEFHTILNELKKSAKNVVFLTQSLDKVALFNFYRKSAILSRDISQINEICRGFFGRI